MAERPDQQNYLDLADQELRRISAITSQTLRFHKQSTAPKLVLCEELLTSVLGTYQARLTNSGVTVEERFRTPNPVSCFEGEIRQVLSNLVGNAIDVMHGSAGRLILRGRESMDWKSGVSGVTITVADTGSGMSRKTVERIFEPFYTTKALSGTCAAVRKTCTTARSLRFPSVPRRISLIYSNWKEIAAAMRKTDTEKWG